MRMPAPSSTAPSRTTANATSQTRPPVPVVRNLMRLRPEDARSLVARHAIGLPDGEIFVVSTERKADGQFLTTTTLLYYAAIRRVTHQTRRQAIVDHAGEIRRLLAAADALANSAVAG